MNSVMFRSLIVALGTLSSLGCPSPAPDGRSSDRDPPPLQHQFQLHGIQIEERRSGRVLWKGTGTEGGGDFETSEISDLRLTRHPQGPSESPITVHSDSARLALGQGEALFSKARITDPAGRVLHAGNAEYSEKTQTIESMGPMSFTASGLNIAGTASLIDLQTGEVTISGPITGRFTPQKQRPPEPPQPSGRGLPTEP